MIAAVALLTYAGFVGTVGGWLLQRARWPERSPRLGILAWQVLTGSALGAGVLAGLAPALPSMPLRVGLAEFLHTCVMHLQQRYATPGGAVVVSLGLLLSFGLVARLGFSLTRSLRTTRDGRKRQREHLALVGRLDRSLGALVVDHASSAAYCLPGREAHVVLTSGALDALDAEQVTAVLAHERAHLRGRHDLVIQLATALQTAFPFVPAFVASAAEITRLTEMAADDAASRRTGRLTLATALVRLAEAGAPSGALGAGGSTAVRRVRRLAGPLDPRPRILQAVVVAGAVTLAAAPLVLALTPALSVAWSTYCPLSIRA